MKKQRREEKGITLVALVVTIIVLIILAGVTLNIVLDNDGIINKAKQAAEDYENAQREEQEILGQVENYIENAGKIAPIPEGYTKSQITTEDDIGEGLVIYEIPEGANVNWTDEEDEKGNNQSTITIGETTTNLQETVNQYVWIPVNDINSMVMCKSNTGESICNLVYDEEKDILKCTTHPETETDLVGRGYDGIRSSEKEEDHTIYLYEIDFSKRNQTYIENSGDREPAVITGYGTEYDADSSNLIVAGMAENSTAEEFLEQLTTDFNVMATSVAKNGGFYISRYEIGENGNSKKNQTVLDNSSTKGNMWYGLYNVCRDIENNKYMIWGCQYDQVIKFIGEEAQIGHNDRNLTISRTVSGQNALDCMKNIYDLEGNYSEWTMEANSSENRISRSSNFDGTANVNYNPASIGWNNLPTSAGGYTTVHSILYL